MKKKPHFEHVPIKSIGPAAVYHPVPPGPPRKLTRKKQVVRAPYSTAPAKSKSDSTAEKAVVDDGSVRHF